MFRFIKYFFYIAFNWNPGIAWYIIMQEIKGEKKYRINTTGADELKDLQKKGIDISHATIYMPVSYSLLEELFTQLHRLAEKSLNHLLDMGCGKGRALCVAVHHGFSRLTGVDISKELCNAASENLLITQKHSPGITYSVINNDAFYFEIPPTVDCVFLFNPFDEIIMSAVVQHLLRSVKLSPRPLYIIYVNPLHKEQFLANGFRELYHYKKMKYLEAVILSLP